LRPRFTRTRRTQTVVRRQRQRRLAHNAEFVWRNFAAAERLADGTEIELRRPLSDDETVDVLRKGIKTRRESVEAFRNGGREDLAAKEESEIAILSKYLPQQLSEAEIQALVDEGIAATGASSARDLGKVMGWLAPRTRGRADGKQVSALVAQSLAAADLVAHDTGGHRA